MQLIVHMIVSPVLPYWLRLRYKIYQMLSQMRKQSLIQKYKRLILVDRWNKETWTVIDAADPST